MLKSKIYITAISSLFVLIGFFFLNKQVSNFNILTIGLPLLFLVSIIIIVVLLIRLEKENKELKKFQDRLKYTLKHDMLTGLLNRNSFEDKQKLVSNPVFLLVNVDRFKNINDFYGVENGDVVLKKVAESLTMICEKYYDGHSHLFRLGGDDFGILIDKIKNSFSIKRFASMIIEEFENKSINIRDLFDVSISVSVAYSSSKPLFETSDMALKYLKGHTSEHYIEYDELMHNETFVIAKNLSTLSMVRNAIKDDRVVPYFQPIFDVKVKEINKYEALIRIIETDGAIVPPAVFLGVAKQSKLYGQLTKIMIHKTFKEFANNNFEFSVNLSYEDVNDEEIIILIENELFIHSHIGPRVIFEITESESVDDYNVLYNFIHKFKQYGCKFAIDDFGSGYSNFEKILKLEVDYIKIDGSLIKDITVDENSKMITKMMVDFAKAKNIKTIAEFVSQVEIKNEVELLGVDYLQGFYIGKPDRYLLT